MENIEKGDLIEYIDTGQERSGKRISVIKIAKNGIWDGEQAILFDSEHTIIRNKKWLKTIKKGDWSCRFDADNINMLIIKNNIIQKNGQCQQLNIAIPPGRNRTDFILLEDTKINKPKFGFIFNFEGILIISNGNERIIMYKGQIVCKKRFKKTYYAKETL